jgi:membrane protein
MMKETQELKARAGHLAKRTAKDWSSRDVATYASSIAFYFFMSMIPVLIIIIQVITRLGLSQRELLDFISRLIPETAYEFTAKIVSEAYKKTTGTISVSALVLLWAASRATMALRCGLNKVYDKEEQRTYPVIHLISIGYTIAVILLFIVMLFLVFAGRVSRFLIERMPDVFDKTVTIELWQRVLIAMLMILILALIFTFVPTGRRNFVKQLPGAVLVAIMWNIFSLLFSIYVEGYNTYTMFYGSLGTIAMFLFWLYWCFYILLIGGYFNRFCGDRWDKITGLIGRKNR